MTAQPIQPGDGVLGGVPDCRDSTRSGTAGECAVVPTGKAIEESVDLADEVFNRVFRTVPEKLK